MPYKYSLNKSYKSIALQKNELNILRSHLKQKNHCYTIKN